MSNLEFIFFDYLCQCRTVSRGACLTSLFCFLLHQLLHSFLVVVISLVAFSEMPAAFLKLSKLLVEGCGLTTKDDISHVHSTVDLTSEEWNLLLTCGAIEDTMTEFTMLESQSLSWNSQS